MSWEFKVIHIIFSFKMKIPLVNVGGKGEFILSFFSRGKDVKDCMWLYVDTGSASTFSRNASLVYRSIDFLSL